MQQPSPPMGHKVHTLRHTPSAAMPPPPPPKHLGAKALNHEGLVSCPGQGGQGAALWAKGTIAGSAHARN